jgi:hypothetical protein
MLDDEAMTGLLVNTTLELQKVNASDFLPSHVSARDLL